ncbi:MAG: hypothetical protein IPO23_12335 [Flavobacterium sp.]|nr:hypothetical protein [Flavobacterium sp.]
MKKIYLFLAISLMTFSLNSCSKDDSSDNIETPVSTGIFKCKVNGVQKTFNTNNFLAAGQVNVVAYIGSKEMPSETIWLTVDENSKTNWDLVYTNLTITQYFPTESFVMNITENNTSTKTIKGTFSGNVEEIGSSNKISLTEGIFDIKY